MDLDVVRGKRRPIPDVPPAGEPIVELGIPGLEYWIVADSSGYLVRFPSLCEFRVAGDLRSITIDLDPGADPRRIELLLTGNVLAFLLGVAGKTVLHATAVEASGRAMAILGPPGSGKSTLAAQLCLAGATLVTEDTMRVELVEPHAYCYRGPGRLRLRAGAAPLAERFPDLDQEPAPDGRITVRPERSPTSRLRLDALLVPKIGPDAASVSLSALGPRDRTLSLIRNPRLIGWRRAKEIGSHFETVAGIADRVPVIEVQIPLDRAMAPELGGELLERIGSQYWASAPV